MNPRNLVFLSTLAVGLLADQATKAWVVANLEVLVDEIQIVPGWFSIVHAQNTGAAFSTMEGQLGLFYVFTAIALVVVLELVRWQLKTARFVPFVLGLILAGALGNGLDRVRMGYVTDFAKAYAGHEPLRSWFIERAGTNVWPIFNVADSLLLIGVALFVGYWLLLRDSEALADEDESAPEAA
ncbi:MAG: signal peptidase II [Myxococcota bacterium]